MRVLLLLALISSGGPANADLFASAGRIETLGAGTCSAALIAPDIIVTAAHCVKDGKASDLVFRPGGRADAKPVPVDRIVVHPHYTGFRNHRIRRLRFDIAIGKLVDAIDPRVAVPLKLGDDAAIGEGLFLASWRNGEGFRPRTRRCQVIKGGVPGVVTLGCRVQGGESGAPVLRLTEAGPELVAVINSQARREGRSVAFAANIRLRIEPLINRLKDGS